MGLAAFSRRVVEPVVSPPPAGCDHGVARTRDGAFVIETSGQVKKLDRQYARQVSGTIQTVIRRRTGPRWVREEIDGGGRHIPGHRSARSR